ncbi:MAG: tripartite tricarboxylate transporter TctB family protein [Alphaproteobacteria bacterium]|nr:tripartite tricarboxylate transporter TctB family protein [Alphaproteobacteria bacterium]
MQIADSVLGAVCAVLGAYMLYAASGFPSFPGQPYGAALLPSLLGVAFIVSGVLLALRDLRARRLGSTIVLFAIQPALKDRRGAISGALIIAVVLMQILFGDLIGFIPVSLVMLTVILLWFGVRVLAALFFAALGTGMCWWLFSFVLKVPLPRGILDGVL